MLSDFDGLFCSFYLTSLEGALLYISSKEFSKFEEDSGVSLMIYFTLEAD